MEGGGTGLPAVVGGLRGFPATNVWNGAISANPLTFFLFPWLVWFDFLPGRPFQLAGPVSFYHRGLSFFLPCLILSQLSQLTCFWSNSRNMDL